MLETEYYSEDAVEGMVTDFEDLLEYLNGLDDAIVDGRYKKRYVDTYVMR